MDRCVVYLSYTGSERLAGALELRQETYVVFGEHTEVLDLIFQVGDTFYAHAERESGVARGIYAARFKHIGIDHSASEDFHPSGVLAERASFASAEIAADVHFGRRFSEGEEAGSETYLGFGSEHLAGEVEESLVQVGEGDVLVDIEGFDLMEEAMRARGDGFVAVYASGTDDADRGG